MSQFTSGSASASGIGNNPFEKVLSIKDRTEFFESRGFNKYMNDNNLSYNEKSVINLVSLLQTINCTSQLQSQLGAYDFKLLCSYIQSDIIAASKKSHDIPIEIYVPRDRKRKNNDMNNSINLDLINNNDE
jgi:hypothetical protein